MYNLLSGPSVIEASSFVASPSAGLYCAQLGAEVIRVDQPVLGRSHRCSMATVSVIELTCRRGAA